MTYQPASKIVTRKTFSAASSAALLALLVGCGSGAQEAQETGTQGANEATQSSVTSAGTTAEPVAQTEAPAAETSPAETSTVAQETAEPAQLPAIEDTCAGVCDEPGRLAVEHPTLGPLEIVLYHEVTRLSAPQSGFVHYAVYQNGTPVGMASSGDRQLPAYFEPFSFAPGYEMVNDYAPNTDRYGNIYFYSYGGGVSVLTPTAEGYASNGTLPGDDNPFQHSRKMHVDAEGEPTIEVPTWTDENLLNYDVVETYVFNGSEFVKSE